MARHVASMAIFADTLEMFEPDKGVTIENIPSYDEMNENGVGYYLVSPR